MRIGDVVLDWLSVLLSWIAAAILVSASHELVSIHPATGLIAGVAAILAVAFLHARGAFPRNHVHPLTVGAVWLALSIGSEMVVSAFLGQEWDWLLGSPENRMYWTILLIAWTLSPSLFARRLTH